MRAALRLGFIAGGLMGAGLALGGCAGRLANPEPVDWAMDKYYTCQDIRAEKDRINQGFVDRHVEQAAIRQRDDDLMSRTIPFLPPGLAAVDETRMSGSAKTPQEVEIDALKARDTHLDQMASARGC
jgi:hypothetical protein